MKVIVLQETTSSYSTKLTTTHWKCPKVPHASRELPANLSHSERHLQQEECNYILGLHVGEYLVYPKMEATDLFEKFLTKYENVRVTI
jgi:hypothetical protein